MVDALQAKDYTNLFCLQTRLQDATLIFQYIPWLNMLKCKKVFTLLLSVLYFWLVSRKLCKGACMWILIRVWIKQISHVRKVKLICQLFLAIVCNSYDWLKPLLTRWKYPLTSKSLRKLEISIKHDRENYKKQRRLALRNLATILHLQRTAKAAQETGWEAQFKLLAIPYNPLDYCLRKDFFKCDLTCNVWKFCEDSVKIKRMRIPIFTHELIHQLNLMVSLLVLLRLFSISVNSGFRIINVAANIQLLFTLCSKSKCV